MLHRLIPIVFVCLSACTPVSTNRIDPITLFHRSDWELVEGWGGTTDYSVAFEIKLPDSLRHKSEPGEPLSIDDILSISEYERWVKSYKLEKCQVEIHDAKQDVWLPAKSVTVDFAYLSDTSAWNDGDMRNIYVAPSFDAIPAKLRLANRQYTFTFADSVAHPNNLLRVSYTLRRPDGTQQVYEGEVLPPRALLKPYEPTK